MKAEKCVSDASVIIPWLHTGVEPNAEDSLRLKMDFDIYDPAQESHPDIAQLAFENGLTAYDALYMHMALELGSPLWTADDALSRAWGKRPGGHIRHYRSR